jgi:choline dehydrogenase
MALRVELPAHADIVVIGAGTSGAALAGTLAERSDATVLVLEAGPDYGPFDRDAWPADLLDSRALPATHQWGYDSASTYPDRVLPFDRARVIGGCSSHNGCAAIVGFPLDYDAWEAAGCEGWGTEALKPLFASALERLRVRRPADEEATPFQRAFLEASPAIGVPRVDDLNEWNEEVGISMSPVNVVDGVRWNAAFAYLDPVRDRPGLTIAGDAMVSRLRLIRGRVDAVEAVRDGRRLLVECGSVVVCGGAYGSPVLLERSGIGDPDVLRGAQVGVDVALPGVGRNLHDHPAVRLTYAGGDGAAAEMLAFAQDRWLPEEQTIAKLKSQFCGPGFDLHMYPVGGPDGDGWRWDVPVACMTPRSRGEIHLTGTDPEATPVIDHAFLSDVDAYDAMILSDGVRLMRELAAAEPLRTFLGDELDALAPAELVERRVEHYYHPVGSCKMGPDSDMEAVVDPSGRVHGTENAYVADCAICPTVPRANTNIPAAVIGLRIAEKLLEAGA